MDFDFWNQPVPQHPPQPYDKDSYLAAVEKENEILDNELKGLIQNISEEEAIKEYQLTPTQLH